MAIRDARVDFEVFVDDATEAIGAVRELHPDHLIVWIENRGDTRIDASQVKSAHDGKVVLDSTALDPELLAAVEHAHDAETRTPGAGVSRD